MTTARFPDLYHPTPERERSAGERLLAQATEEERLAVRTAPRTPVTRGQKGWRTTYRAPIRDFAPTHQPPTALGACALAELPVQSMPESVLDYWSRQPVMRTLLARNPTMRPADWAMMSRSAISTLRLGSLSCMEWLVLQQSVTGSLSDGAMAALVDGASSAHLWKGVGRLAGAAGHLWLDPTVGREVLMRYVNLPVPEAPGLAPLLRALGTALVTHPASGPTVWHRLALGLGWRWGVTGALASLPAARRDPVVAAFLATSDDPVVMAYLALDAEGEEFWARITALVGRHEGLVAAVLSHPDCRGVTALDPDFLGLLLAHASDPVRMAMLTGLHRTTDSVPLTGPPVVLAGRRLRA